MTLTTNIQNNKIAGRHLSFYPLNYKIDKERTAINYQQLLYIGLYYAITSGITLFFNAEENSSFIIILTHILLFGAPYLYYLYQAIKGNSHQNKINISFIWYKIYAENEQDKRQLRQKYQSVSWL